MSEQKSDPNQTSKQPLDDAAILEAFNKISAIAAQESNSASPDTTEKTEREAETYEGKTPTSALLSQLGQAETEKENAQLKNEQLKSVINRYNLENESLKHKNNEEVILDKARRTYTRNLFILTLFWLIVVVIFVSLTGFSYSSLNNPKCVENCVNFSLSDNVLIAFITSTTATVIGIFIIVATWLFPSPKAKQETKEK